jgi:uncharacterized membrane protein YfcA
VSPEVYVIAAASVAVGAFVQGTIGVGFALIAVPIIALLDSSLLPVSVLVLMIPLNIYVIWREHTAIDWSGAGWITVGRVFGTVGGITALAFLVPAYLNPIIGVVTMLAAGVTFLAPYFEPDRRALLGAGLITGNTETATGVGGPPLALVYQHQPGPILRSTVAICFLAGQVLSLAALLAAGRMHVAQLTAAAALFPALAVGGFASRHAHRRVSGPLLRRFVLAFAVLAGLALVIMG